MKTKEELIKEIKEEYLKHIKKGKVPEAFALLPYEMNLLKGETVFVDYKGERRRVPIVRMRL